MIRINVILEFNHFLTKQFANSICPKEIPNAGARLKFIILQFNFIIFLILCLKPNNVHFQIQCSVAQVSIVLMLTRIKCEMPINSKNHSVTYTITTIYLKQ